jgi:hypothetical protein
LQSFVFEELTSTAPENLLLAITTFDLILEMLLACIPLVIWVFLKGYHDPADAVLGRICLGMATLETCESSVILKAQGREMAEPQLALQQIDLNKIYEEATRLPFNQIVRRLRDIIGSKLTAYIASVKDVRALDRWENNVNAQGDVEARLRVSYRVVSLLSKGEGPKVIQSWLQGMNPNLDDVPPIALLKEGNLQRNGKKALDAAWAFVTGE